MFYTNITDAVDLNNTTFDECFETPDIVGAMAIIAENEANYNTIMQVVGLTELAYFQENGQEMVYEAGNISGFSSKAKEFFKKVWEKLKGLFNKFFAMFNSYAKSDKEFINKYKKHLTQVNTNGFKYKGFNFTHLKDFSIESAKSSIDGKKPDFANKIADKSDLVEKMRGAVLKQNSLTSSELTKGLFEYFRNGEDSKQEIERVSVSDQLMHISANSDLKKAAEKAYKGMEKSIKEAIKEIEKSEKEALKNVDYKSKDSIDNTSNSMVEFSNKVWFLKEQSSVLQICNGAYLTALKDQNRQAKSICVSLMNYKPKNEGYNFNSGDMFNEGFLGSVVLK